MAGSETGDGDFEYASGVVTMKVVVGVAEEKTRGQVRRDGFFKVDDSVPKLLNVLVEVSHGPGGAAAGLDGAVDRQAISDPAGLEVCKKEIPDFEALISKVVGKRLR